MLKVELDKIITEKALEQHLDSILNRVEDGGELFVITKKGLPKAALINVDYLEELTGRSVAEESDEYDDYHKFSPSSTPAPEIKTPVEQPIAPPARQIIEPTAPEIKNEPETVEESNLPDLDLEGLDFDTEPNQPNDQPDEQPMTPEPPTPEPDNIPPVSQPLSLNDIVMPVPPVDPATIQKEQDQFNPPKGPDQSKF